MTVSLRNAVAGVVLAMGLTGASVSLWASDPLGAPEAPSLWERDTLTNEWFGAGSTLAEMGITVDLGFTYVYQANTRGGLSTHRRKGRHAGRYDLELTVDTETLFGLPGGTLYSLAKGGWSDGIDPPSVGSLFGVNSAATGDRAIDVAELWYEQALFDGLLRVRLGKIDLTAGFESRGAAVGFDSSAFANDETAQFLNGSLVNNPSIPFPDYGLGMAAVVQPLEWLYLAAGMADAHGDIRTTGFRTTFRSPADFFTIYEAGITPLVPSANGPLPGAYRAGLWYDTQTKDRFDGLGEKRNDIGFYVSVDQMVFKPAEGDDRGLGLFARFGAADSAVNEIKSFWSLGAQYQGLIPTRDDDVLAFGVGQGRLSRAADFTASHETAMEVYYNARVTPWLSLTPSVQYIVNPGGERDVSSAVVVGMRLQVTF